MKEDWSWKPPKEDVERRKQVDQQLRAGRAERKLKRKERKAKKKKTRRFKDPFYESKEWKQIRYKVLKKYGAKCMLCNTGREHGIRMHVDHIIPRFHRPDLELDFNNLQVLCETCNIGKGASDSTDFRPVNMREYVELEQIKNAKERI